MYTEKDNKCIYSDFIICVADDLLMDVDCNRCLRNPNRIHTSLTSNGSDYEQKTSKLTEEEQNEQRHNKII